MDDKNSSASGVGEDQQNYSREQKQSHIVGVHPLYLLLPRQIPSLLSSDCSIPVTGSEGYEHSSRFVTPYLRQLREYPAGSLPSVTLDFIERATTN